MFLNYTLYFWLEQCEKPFFYTNIGSKDNESCPISPENVLIEGGKSKEETVVSQALVNDTEVFDHGNDALIHSDVPFNIDEMLALIQCIDDKTCLST